MDKEMRELLQAMDDKREEGKALAKEGKTNEAEKVADELDSMRKEFDILSRFYEKEKINLDNHGNSIHENNTDNKVKAMNAFGSYITGKATAEELDVFDKITIKDSGETLVIPETMKVDLDLYRKEYKQAKSLVNVVPTRSLSGKTVYDTGDVNGLVSFDITDETAELDGTDRLNIKQKTYAIESYGAFLPLSNAIISLDPGALMRYIGVWFSRRAIITENTEIFKIAKADTTAVELADWKDLKSLLNTGLDPIYSGVTRIVTNQTGFDLLDKSLDTVGRPILQPNPVNPTQHLFKGISVEIFSDNQLPNEGTEEAKKAPFFVGSMFDSIQFMDLGLYSFDTSTHARFTKYQTLLRVVEHFDVVKINEKALLYCTMPVA